MKRVLFLLALSGLSALFLVPAVQAQPRERCFPETSACITSPLLEYWERNGGLAVFGYPISVQRLETVEGRTLEVQWFERDRLEIQADGTVTAGRLGARLLEFQGRPWETLPRVDGADPGCQFFAITGHQLCEPFLRYWRRNGGLARFGYPITEVFRETIEGREYDVQYFERRRMEYHPENAGTRYDVLLGLLGSILVWEDGCVPLAEPYEATAYAYRNILGCPGGASRELVGTSRFGLRDVPLALQDFERGTMLWVRQFAGDVMSPGSIFVIAPDPGRQALVWQQYEDTWHEGLPTGIDEQPPPGLYAPMRGFGYLWANNRDVRDRLGWATAPEHGESGGYRAFRKGFMLYRPATDRFYLVTNDGVVRDVPRVQ